MKWFVYNALFAVVYIALLPSFLLRMARRGGYRSRFADRFGRYPGDVRKALAALSGKAVWIHAVSVGEVAVAGQMIRSLRGRDPSLRFVFSTTSSTGWKQALREISADDVLIYNPIDFPGCVRRALDAARPRAVILVESEIWPNFIRVLKRRGIPAYLVNARVSDRSAPRYRKMRWFFGDVFRCFTRIFAQSKMDASRLAAAGADPRAIETTGSFKFDVARRNPGKEKEIREWLGDGPFLLGGSTWPGEDAVLLEIYAKLKKKHPEFKLAIVPRHFEKADAVEANIRAAGFGCIRRSRGDTLKDAGSGTAVFLGDTTGEMMGFYGCAEIAFTGKSLCAHGSQNMIEPCVCGCATLTGPYTENFRPVMADLLESRAVVQVQDAAGLEKEILRLADDAGARAELSARAAAAVAGRCGVVGRCADSILSDMRRG